jgi:hypothetical protein
MSLSRREFVIATASALGARGTAAFQRPLTAQDVIDRLKANVGLPWREKTIDGLKAGQASTPVTGIAVTVAGSLEALRRAAADGHNFIVVHEPTFYAPNDSPGPRATDPVYLAKKAFVDEQKLVIFRLMDHWQARQPNPSATALADALGWTKRSVDDELIYAMPPTTLAGLMGVLRDRLGARALRVVGRREMTVSTALVSAGTTDMPAMLRRLPKADVVIAGEPREWEAVPYALDTWSTDNGKGMIALGRVVSLGPGARMASAWIRSFVSEVPVSFISTPDPYWIPALS